MRVVADSHAIVWYIQGSARLSEPAAIALAEAEAVGGLVMSVATLIDLWYVTETTQAVTAAQLKFLWGQLVASPDVSLEPVNVAVAETSMRIARTVLPDPWDRLIVATALALEAPLVSRDGAIARSGLVRMIW